MTTAAVRNVLEAVREPLSLQASIGGDEEALLGDLVEDRHIPSPVEAAMAAALEEHTRKALTILTPREEQIIRLRFGVDQKCDHTLEEVGRRFALTRERIRQIEARALGKLRSPRCAHVLESLVRSE